MYLVLFCCCPHSKLINSARLETRLSKGSSVCWYMSVCLRSSENLFCYSNDFLHDAQVPLQKTHADMLSLSPPGPNSLCFPPLAKGADNQHTSGSGCPGCTLSHWCGSARSVELRCPCNWPDVVILQVPVHTS